MGIINSSRAWIRTRPSVASVRARRPSKCQSGGGGGGGGGGGAAVIKPKNKEKRNEHRTESANPNDIVAFRRRRAYQALTQLQLATMYASTDDGTLCYFSVFNYLNFQPPRFVKDTIAECD